MKPTRSLDGVARVTVQVPHRLDRDDVVNAVCFDLRYDWEPGDEVRLTKAGVERTVRNVLRSSGAEAPAYWSDGLDTAEDADELRDAVTAEVRRLFPALGAFH
jgi:hypothetical protein